MKRSFVRWGVRGVGALAAVWLAVWAPIFDWMAPDRVEHVTERAPDRPSPRLVVLISIDGLAPTVLESTPTPNLDRLAREGTAARSARTVIPSITLASHASMISGATPASHGILFNRYQPWSQVELPTLFTQCDRLGFRCGLFAGKRKFAHFAEFERGVERYVWGESAHAVLEETLHYIREASPDFAMVHLAEVDWAGHDDGWGSDTQRERLKEIDALLGPFLTQVDALVTRPFTILVTADHGGHGTTHGSASRDDVAIPWIVWGDGVSASTLESVETVQTAAAVLSLLGADVPEGWPQSPLD